MNDGRARESGRPLLLIRAHSLGALIKLGVQLVQNE
jgi:hypothetical protein